MCSRLEVADDVKNLEKQSERDGDCAGGGQPIYLTSLFGAKIEKHDNEKKKNNDRAGVHQHLNDADEIGVERHEERGEAEERNDETECARHRIAVDNHSGAENQHQRRKNPK